MGSGDGKKRQQMARGAGDGFRSDADSQLEGNGEGDASDQSRAANAMSSPSSIDVNAADTDGVTELMRAARRGGAGEAISELVERGADVNAKDDDGWTALMHAAVCGHVGSISELAERGADVDAKSVNGRTALMYAAMCGHIESVSELVKSGADMNTRDNDGQTALIRATMCGHVRAMSELAERGADVNVQDSDGRTALMRAAENGRVEAIAQLAKVGADVNVKDNDRRTALMRAAASGHVKAVAELCQSGAMTDDNASDGKSALWYAVRAGHRRVVIELLRRDDSTTSSDRLALFVAAAMGDVGAITELIAEGVPVNGTIACGKTPLFHAATCGQTDAARLLIEHGASVRATLRSSGSSWDGYTPLLVAARAGNMEAVQALVDAGAPVNVRGSVDGETPLISAARWDFFAGVQLRIAHGGTLCFEDVSDDEYPLISGSLETMSSLCADTFEFASLCIRVVDRMHGICAQLQQLEPARRQEGSLVSLSSTVFRVCRLLFDIQKRQRPLSRFIASRAVAGRIQDFHEELDHFVDMLGLAQDGTSWKEQWSGDLAQLQTRFQELLGADDVLVRGCHGDEDRFETATSLQYELNLCGVEESGETAREGIERVLQRFLRLCGIDAPVVPEWFVSRDDVEFHSWNLVRSEENVKCYAGKWRSASVIVEPVEFDKWFEGSETNKPAEFVLRAFAKAASQWHKQSHPNVVKLFGACHIGAPLLLVYELVPGGRPLHEFLREGSNRGLTWRLLREAALGLQYLHNRGVIHSNLQSENIIVGSDLAAKLSSVYEDRRRRYQNHRSAYNWMAPELVRERAPPSSASDVYAFGMCIWEAVTLELPWRELDWYDTREVVRDDNFPERPAVMRDTEWDLITKMCAREPSDRVNIAYVVNRLKQFALERELSSGGSIQSSTTPTRAAEQLQCTSLEEHLFAELDGATIPKTLRVALEKCAKLEDDRWMAEKVYPALESIFALLQDRYKTPTDVEVVAFCEMLSRFQRYLRTAVSERSVFELARSRQVADSHHVVYSQLDRVLDMLGVAEADPIRAWKTDDGAAIGERAVTSSISSTLQLKAGGSSSTAVVLTHFDVPSADHAGWTKAGLAASATDPSWYLSLRDLLFNKRNEIGQGSFGAVYKGSWLDTPVVVKFMGYEEDVDTISTDLLLHEVRMWHRLNHPHVLKLYGACHVDKRYFVCEFASNGELLKYLKKPVNKNQKWQKMHEAALGLQYLHSQNVAHNDLKCDNIMVGMDGKAKLIDFGLSCLLNEAEIQIDVKKMGAVNWRSPEYLAGERPSFASDVYSFAMCIIEVASGEVPWGRSMNPSMVRFNVKKGKIPTLSESMDSKQRNLIQLMTKKEPSERAKMAFVVNKLDEIAQDEKATSAP